MPGLSIASLFVGVSADTSRAESQLGSFQGTLHNVASQLESTGAGITTAVGAPVGALGGAIIKLGADFETGLSRVRKTTGLTTAETEALGKGLLDLSASAAGGGRSADELTKIAEVAGQLGVAKGDILDFTRVIAQFSSATGIAGDQAAAGLNAIVLLNGLQPKQIENVSSAIVQLGNDTAATEAQILEFANRLSGALHTAGASTEDVLGISATLAELQIDPEAGGTAISKFFIDMAKAASNTQGPLKDTSKESRELHDHLSDLTASLNAAQAAQAKFGRNTSAAEVQNNATAIERYKREIAETQADIGKLDSKQKNAAGSAEAMAKVAGLTTDEFRNLVKSDPTAAFQRIVEGIHNISQTQGGGAAFAALKDLGIDDERQVRAVLALAEGSGHLQTNLDSARASFAQNTAAADENAKAMEATNAKFDLLTNGIKKQLIEAWDVLKPRVEAAMSAIQENVVPVLERARVAFAGLDPDLQTFIITLGAIAVVMGPALVVFGLLAGALSAISLPVLAVAAVVAVLAAAWISNFGDIQGKTFAVVDAVGQAFQAVRKVWDENSGAIINAWNGLMTPIMTVAGRIQSVMVTAFIFVLTLADRVLREVGQFFTDHLQGPIQAVGKWIGDNILGGLVELLKFLQQLLANTGLGGALNGLDINGAIRQGELALQNLSGNIAAGGPGGGTANSIVVNLNNPQVPDQTAAEQLAQKVTQIVSQAFIAAEAASSAPANIPLPGTVPGGGPF